MMFAVTTRTPGAFCQVGDADGDRVGDLTTLNGQDLSIWRQVGRMGVVASCGVRYGGTGTSLIPRTIHPVQRMRTLHWVVGPVKAMRAWPDCRTARATCRMRAVPLRCRNHPCDERRHWRRMRDHYQTCIDKVALKSPACPPPTSAAYPRRAPPESGLRTAPHESHLRDLGTIRVPVY